MTGSLLQNQSPVENAAKFSAMNVYEWAFCYQFFEAGAPWI
jgi:hypothetical protein